MEEVFNTIPTGIWSVIFVLSVWESVWKALALYRAGTLKQPAWFIVMFVFNTVGLLPILYYFYFSKRGTTSR